ncbi:GNAT family N-acetyltransferase [Natronolimnobius baerhuensis]|uniref:GNAT family N-acetyltransferase n=1 Tax=Natronolimnobius baerhuensis TaxID=253108 RepID=UPI0006D1AAED|nr:GNAT family N-acetyltransferase [Natronolimnobius baerhuensis]
MATDQTDRPTETAGDDESTATDAEADITSPDDEDDPYVIRPYEPDDRDDFLELYDQVLGDRNDEWFRWKYEDNPYSDHVPMIVATDEGRIVGTKPAFALELRIGEETYQGLQPADVMVHEDHRRRGLYSRTTERLKERYRDREAALFFNFPNEATLSGSLKHGWQIVEEVPTYYRVQRPDALAGDNERLETLAKFARPFAGAYLRTRDVTVRSPRDVTVRRFADVPVEQFVELAEQARPGTIHANRDETFYEWRFNNPLWSYDAYVATRGGEPLAGIITGTRTDDGTKETCLSDVAPLGTTPDRRDGLVAILERILADRRDVAMVAASGRAIPSDLLAQFGFRSDQSLPFSKLTQPTTQVTYPLAGDGGHEWTVAGRAITDPLNWTVTFAEQDTW